MNSYWCVAQTYIYRPRFWTFAAVYLLMVYWWFSGIDEPLRMFASANLAALAGAFLALHLRRQFGTAAARVVPGFAVTHLLVGFVAGLLLWLVFPAVFVAIGQWPPRALALHAIPGLMIALVACGPRTIILLAALPVVLAELMQWSTVRDNWLGRLLALHEAGTTAGALAIALAAQVVAAWALLRLDDQCASVDDLAIDETVTRQPNRFQRWRLQWRDATIRHSLAAPGGLLWSVRRWRVGVAVSWQQFTLPAVVVLGVLGVALMLGGTPWGTREGWLGFAMATMFATTSVLVVAPYASWHGRRHWLGRELLRPVTRRKYLRQLAAALAIDVMLWTVLASVLSAAVLYAIFKAGGLHERPEPLIEAHLGVLWSLALALYGIALVTFGIRFWIPTIVMLAGLWAIGFWSAVIRREYQNKFAVGPTWHDLYWFVGASAVLALLLIAAAYRRWLSADLA